jgi:hypothetical protein
MLLKMLVTVTESFVADTQLTEIQTTEALFKTLDFLRNLKTARIS